MILNLGTGPSYGHRSIIFYLSCLVDGSDMTPLDAMENERTLRREASKTLWHPCSFAPMLTTQTPLGEDTELSPRPTLVVEAGVYQYSLGLVQHGIGARGMAGYH